MVHYDFGKDSGSGVGVSISYLHNVYPICYRNNNDVFWPLTYLLFKGQLSLMETDLDGVRGKCRSNHYHTLFQRDNATNSTFRKSFGSTILSMVTLFLSLMCTFQTVQFPCDQDKATIPLRRISKRILGVGYPKGRFLSRVSSVSGDMRLRLRSRWLDSCHYFGMHRLEWIDP